MQIFNELEPNCHVWLHTQTWSHVAIRLYHQLGFNMVKQGKLANRNTRDGKLKIYPNDFFEAIDVLGNVMEQAILLELVNTAV